MSGRYTPLHSSIWSDPEWIALEPEAQRLYLLIISQPDMSYAGVTSYTPRRWARMSAATTVTDIDAALSLLIDARFVIFDDFTEEVMVRSFVKHNKVYEQKQLRNALKRAFDGILSPALKRSFWVEQIDEVKDLVGSPAAASPAALPKAAHEPSGRLPARLPEGSGQEPDLDLDPDREPGEGPEAAGLPSIRWTVLVAENCSPSFVNEGESHIEALSADYDDSRLIANAVEQLIADGRRFQFASHMAKAIRKILGDPVGRPQPSPLDATAAAARKREAEGAAHLAAVKDEIAATVPESREERVARLERIRAERAERTAS